MVQFFGGWGFALLLFLVYFDLIFFITFHLHVDCVAFPQRIPLYTSDTTTVNLFSLTVLVC